MAKITIPQDGYIAKYSFSVYDEYIKNGKIGIVQKFKYCPLFKSAEQDLMKLLGEIPTEIEAIYKAQGLYLEKPNELKIIFLNNASLYQALIQVLVDHFLRSLGWMIWYMGWWEKSDLYALLQWYVEQFGIQKSPSELIVIREFFDYSQALTNVQNRIQSTSMALLRSVGEKKKKFDCIQWKLCKFADCNVDIESLKKAEKKVLSYRNAWVHEISEKYYKEFVSNSEIIIKFIELSYRSAVLKYEGLYRWYLDPITNRFD